MIHFGGQLCFLRLAIFPPLALGTFLLCAQSFLGHLLLSPPSIMSYLSLLARSPPCTHLALPSPVSPHKLSPPLSVESFNPEDVNPRQPEFPLDSSVVSWAPLIPVPPSGVLA